MCSDFVHLKIDKQENVAMKINEKLITSCEEYPCYICSFFFSNEATGDKYRNDFIINIRIYSSVNKVRIPFEDCSTLRSNISVIYREDLVGPISSYFQGHPHHDKCKFNAKYACAFCDSAI